MFQNLNKTLADLDEQELVTENHANILDTEEDEFFVRLDESGIPLSETDDSDHDDEDLDEIEKEVGEDLDGDGDEGDDDSDNSDEEDSDEDDSSLFLDESFDF